MQETRSGTERARFARWSTLIATVALVAAACSNPAASPSAATAAPASEAPASQAPASEAPASAAAEKFKIGYISLGDSVPFVKLVSDGIREEAKKAGQELLFCDSEIDEAKALSCAQTLKVQGAQGVLNFVEGRGKPLASAQRQWPRERRCSQWSGSVWVGASAAAAYPLRSSSLFHGPFLAQAGAL